MPTLDTYRKQAKLLMRWHREQNPSVGERLRQAPRHATLTDQQILERPFSLTLAQEVVAAEAGYPDWASLKTAVAGAPKTPGPKPGPVLLSAVAPIFMVRDVQVAAEHYRDRLGFHIDFLYGHPPLYCGLSRDDVCLHLRFCPDPTLISSANINGQLLLATFEASSTKSLFAELRERGADIVRPLKKEPWGGTTFHVRDLDGNVISFAS